LSRPFFIPALNSWSSSSSVSTEDCMSSVKGELQLRSSALFQT
jgi:hypothetical protein